MKFAFIAAEKAFYDVRKLCKMLLVSRSGFYAWLERPASEREKENEVLSANIRDVFESSRRTYGAPRLMRELRSQGRRCSKKRVARLMRENGLQARKKKRFVRSVSVAPGGAVENHLKRKFRVDEPNSVWVGDTTYLWTREGWCYLAVLVDLYSRMVVGWAMASKNDEMLVRRAFEMAHGRRHVKSGLIHHTDQGSTYAATSYQKRLLALGVVPSMSRRGNCWDNAVAESFFKTFKQELYFPSNWQSRAEALRETFSFIEVFYNRQRSHSLLDYVSPARYEEDARKF